MKTRRRFLISLTGTLGVLALALLVLMVVAPGLINSESMRQKMLSEVSERLNAQVLCQEVRMVFLPRPGVKIHHGSIIFESGASGTWESLTIYPAVVPLFMGKVQIAKLRLDAPDLRIDLPRREADEVRRKKDFSAAHLVEKFVSALALITTRTPGMTIQIKDGKLSLGENDAAPWVFQNLQGRVVLPPKKLRIEFACKSNLWESLSLKGWMNSLDFQGGAQIRMVHFQPQALIDYLFPGGTQPVAESDINLDINLTTKRLKTLRAEVHGAMPLLTLGRHQEKQAIRCRNFAGSLLLDEEMTLVVLDRLDLEQPQLRMTGKFYKDHVSPQFGLFLEGQDIDVPSTRNTALALFGKYRTAQKIFDVIRGGRVPRITFSTHGQTAARMGKAKNIVIKGTMEDGKIHVPGVLLDLEEVQGDVVVSRGVLEGEGLRARLGKSLGRDAKLKLGLRGHNAPFHLDIMIQADLAQLPPILARLVKNETLATEMGLIQEVQGEALGRLILGERLKSVKTSVDVSRFHLQGSYQRIPYPVEIKQGKFLYESDKVTLADAVGNVGKSSISSVSARVDWEQEFRLEVDSRDSEIILDEVYPWLLSYEKPKNLLKHFPAAKGAITLETLELKGPLLKPEQWDFQVTGDFHDVTLDSTLLPGALTLAGGKFKAVPDQLLFIDSSTRILDASVALSGNLGGYLQGLNSADLMLQGNVGPQAGNWIGDAVKLPPQLKMRSPFSVSKAHLTWDRNAITSFAGEIATEKGPQVALDMHRTPREINIKNLTIRDRESNATLDFKHGNGEINVGFQGNLTKSTLDALLVDNQCLTGWAKGDLRSRIVLDQPAQSSAQGTLQGSGLVCSWMHEVPVVIENVALEASKQSVNVRSADFTWDGKKLAVQGNVTFSGQAFILDVDLNADTFHWEKLRRRFQEPGSSGATKHGKSFWDIPLRGTVRLRSQSFQYGKYTWSPFAADLGFGRRNVEVTVNQADLCGVSTPGVLQFQPDQMQFLFKPKTADQALDPAITCLMNKQGLMTGYFSLTGELSATARPGELTSALQGDLNFLARDGRIHRFGLLGKILAVVNVTEIFRGKLPDVVEEGFAYNTIRANGHLQNGTLEVKEGIIDGSSMEIVWQGNIDLVQQKVDLTVLVAPLKTVDVIVKNIPLVNDVLGGSLVSFPVKVSGDLADPNITPLSPSAVGSGILGVMKRTLNLPYKIIEPVLPQ